MASGDKMLRALLRSVELGVIYQLGVRLHGMVYVLCMYYIHWVQKAKRNPPARKRAYCSAW